MLIMIIILSTSIISCKKNDIVTSFDSTNPGGQIVPPPGYKLLWNDEFNSSTLDASKWNYEVNGNGGGKSLNSHIVKSFTSISFKYIY